MSIEERLYALAAQYRDQQGATAFAAIGQLIARLSAQAPDLHAEIRALAVLIETGAGARVAAAADPEGEAQRIAAEVAASHKLSMAAIVPAMTVARRLGPIAAPIPAAGGWAGDSVAVGAAPMPSHAPAYAPAPAASAAQPATPIWKNKWALGGAGAVLALVAYQSMQPAKLPPVEVTAQGPVTVNGQPTGENPPGPVPADAPVAAPFGGPGEVPNGQPMAPGAPDQGRQSGGLPLLGKPGGGALPALRGRQAQNGGFSFGFTIPSQSGNLSGLVTLPPQGWDNGPAIFAFARAGTTDNFETFGQARFEAANSQGSPARIARPQWEKDGLGLRQICVAFAGDPGKDVALQGATMCVLDSQCGQPLGCAKIQ